MCLQPSAAVSCSSWLHAVVYETACVEGIIGVKAEGCIFAALECVELLASSLWWEWVASWSYVHFRVPAATWNQAIAKNLIHIIQLQAAVHLLCYLGTSKLQKLWTFCVFKLQYGNATFCSCSGASQPLNLFSQVMFKQRAPYFLNQLNWWILFHVYKFCSMVFLGAQQ